MTPVEITGVRQREAWVAGVMPPVERVRPGVWSIPVPIPINPLRYVLVYAFELPDGVAIVDAGWDTEDAWQGLTAGLAEAGYTPGDVRAVLVTHIHPDHYSLAGRVREVSGAWIGLHPADAALLRDRYDEASLEDLVRGMRSLLARCGVPESDADDLANASRGVRRFVQQARPDVLIADGDTIDLPGWDLRAIWTPGHSPGHLCFYERGLSVLLSGDHVLPRISPNISVHAQQRPNPLADYLDSLAAVGEIAAVEVFPAHEYRFSGLAERTRALIAHHDERLAEITAALDARPGSTCWEITQRLTWSRPFESLPPFLKRSANGETLAHLVALEATTRARRVPGAPDRWYRIRSGNTPDVSPE